MAKLYERTLDGLGMPSEMVLSVVVTIFKRKGSYEQ